MNLIGFLVFFVTLRVQESLCKPPEVIDGFGMDLKEIGTDRKLCPPMKDIPQPKVRVNTSAHLLSLRKSMVNHTVLKGPAIDAYIIPSFDEHQSEEVHPRDRRLKFMSGFSGNYGFAVVTATKAALWVSGLDELQADLELSCDWLLMKSGHPGVPTIAEWVKDELGSGMRVGVDPKIIPNTQFEFLQRELNNASIILDQIQNNLVDQSWVKNRPLYPIHDAFFIPTEIAGESFQAKFERVRRTLRSMDCDALVVTALDEIAWLLNIRAWDLPHSPFLRAYLAITESQVLLYTDEKKLPQSVRTYLRIDYCTSPLCVRVKEYEKVWNDLRNIGLYWTRVWLPSQIAYSAGVSKSIHSLFRDKQFNAPSPIIEMKALKNEIEMKGMRDAHVRDAVIFCDALAYIEDQYFRGELISEQSIASTLDTFRKENTLSRGISFDSVVAYGEHAALPHYNPSNVTNKVVGSDNPVLIDSGGHYMDGTTDVSRTIHLGSPTAEQIQAYTLTLQGMIRLATAVFPAHLHSNQLDILARAPLWKLGRDYPHSTGHGIGAFSSVHESPIELYYRSDQRPLKKGYFTSIEPGFYKEDEYGIRLEDIFQVVYKADTEEQYLTFEPVTAVPFEPKMIDIDLLGPEEIRYLNAYNQRIADMVGSELKRQKKMAGFYWLEKRLLTYDIPHSKANNAGLVSPQAFLLLVAFLCSFLMY
uniref:Xaa-Pro aminopeptidase 2 n=1 Tax=Cacopsylla melanoneura TaxID=428564 RepID=A0A8D8ZW92_9HEMI